MRRRSQFNTISHHPAERESPTSDRLSDVNSFYKITNKKTKIKIGENPKIVNSPHTPPHTFTQNMSHRSQRQRSVHSKETQALHRRAANKTDFTSLSDPSVARTTHLDLNVTVSFESQTLTGTASYDVELGQSNASRESVQNMLTLDTKFLVISKCCVDNEEVKFTLSPPHEIYGTLLSVPLNGKKKQRVVVFYKTTKQSTAIQWLPPSQTLGKKYPYMFTQCQAIHCRAMVPCQDTPGNKITYDVTVTTPSWATCLCSALQKSRKVDESAKTATSLWSQLNPTSTYLIAFAIGNLASRDISDRCRVWSEPENVDKVAFEFDETESFLKTAEDLTLPYQWGRYDLVSLPPSFPYGGMENPSLTFVTPTLLAGDRSLADVVAHEIAHSWTGNLVTNATWEHFWLNEGWTMWLQRKIMSRMKKDDRFFDFDAIGGYNHLEDDIALLPEEFQRMVPVLDDKDPDDAFSTVPYEKGFNLLYNLEKRVGTPAFEKFAKNYLKHFSKITVTSQEFQDFFMDEFGSHPKMSEFDWDAWLHTGGMPYEAPTFDRTLSEASENLARDWLGNNSGSSNEVPSVDITGWTSNQTCCFLDSLLEQTSEKKKALKIETVRAMDSQYKMSASQNCEILFRFCKLSILAEDSAILPVACRFITSQGRMKYIRPLYRALYASKMGRQVAVDTFIKNKEFYHSIGQTMVGRDLNLTGKEDQNVDNKQRDVLMTVMAVSVVAIFGIVLTRAWRKK